MMRMAKTGVLPAAYASSSCLAEAYKAVGECGIAAPAQQEELDSTPVSSRRRSRPSTACARHWRTAPTTRGRRAARALRRRAPSCRRWTRLRDGLRHAGASHRRGALALPELPRDAVPVGAPLRGRPTGASADQGSRCVGDPTWSPRLVRIRTCVRPWAPHGGFGGSGRSVCGRPYVVAPPRAHPGLRSPVGSHGGFGGSGRSVCGRPYVVAPPRAHPGLRSPVGSHGGFGGSGRSVCGRPYVVAPARAHPDLRSPVGAPRGLRRIRALGVWATLRGRPASCASGFAFARGGPTGASADQVVRCVGDPTWSPRLVRIRVCVRPWGSHGGFGGSGLSVCGRPYVVAPPRAHPGLRSPVGSHGGFGGSGRSVCGRPYVVAPPRAHPGLRSPVGAPRGLRRIRALGVWATLRGRPASCASGLAFARGGPHQGTVVTGRGSSGPT